MLTNNNHRLLSKIWIEHNGKPLLGRGGADILKGIKETKSISKTAKKVGMSYRYVWNYLAKIEKILQEPVILTFRGGKSGGGGAQITKLGENLLKEYNRAESYMNEVLNDTTYWEAVGLKISARNRLKGIVQKVTKGPITAKVKIKIDESIVITSIISKEAVEDLDIKNGDLVEAIIKATEVMISKDK